jgi:hypothetical protein
MTAEGWIAPAVDRRPEPLSGGERESLEGWLDYHRDTLLTKCAGLTAEQLRTRSVPPSTLSLLGLVRHMTEVEQSWFRVRMTGAELPPLYYSDDNPDGDFDDVDSADPEVDLATFLAEVERCREAVAGLDLDETFQARIHRLDLRWIFLHMIEEYARHNGHADLLRERIDGVTGD